jgi:uncharacterized membrane protein HdeD (DUF308 family)
VFIVAKKIAGITLIAVGAVVLGFLVSNGMIFPHLIGPAVLITAGVLLLVIKRKGKKK